MTNSQILRRIIILLAVTGSLSAYALHGCMNSHSRPRGHNDISFDLPPDGKRIVFNAVGKGGRDLFLLDLQTMQVTPLAQTPDYEGAPTFSPDGRSILYASGPAGDRADHIYIRPLNSPKAKQLTHVDYNDENPAYSTDGSQIIFTRNLTYGWGGLAASWGSDWVICAMNPDGSELRRINSSQHRTLDPHYRYQDKDVSSDGKLVAAAHSQYSNTLYLRDKTGKRSILRLEVPGSIEAPRFTPDGKRIFFLLEQWPNGGFGDPKRSLWQTDTAGKTPSMLAGSELFDAPLTWKP